MKEAKENHPLFINEFDYQLPDNRIAKFPIPRRDASKLLVYNDSVITESTFSNIIEFLPADSLLVYNNTRVIQARLIFQKETGARIEVFCLEPITPADYAQSLGSTSSCEWKCMVGNLKKWKEGNLNKEIVVGGEKFNFTAELLQTQGNTHQVQFSWDNANVHFAEILETAGELPIPPYLHRKTVESDLTTYQTVYSKIKGSVAAPTAGLHFTPEVFESLTTKDIEIEELTLHVGAGTFQPVKALDVADHQMHTEIIMVRKETIEHLIQKLGNIVAVGTTSVRTLESLYYVGLKLQLDKNSTDFHIQQWMPYESKVEITVENAFLNILEYMEKWNLSSIQAETQILIKPGYKFHVVNAMITNFHQPKSTLLLLVSAFVNGNWHQIYNYALNNDFRFLSYGDSSLLFRK